VWDSGVSCMYVFTTRRRVVGGRQVYRKSCVGERMRVCVFFSSILFTKETYIMGAMECRRKEGRKEGRKEDGKKGDGNPNEEKKREIRHVKNERAVNFAFQP